jgi:lysophospholipase L1-like esterase
MTEQAKHRVSGVRIQSKGQRARGWRVGRLAPVVLLFCLLSCGSSREGSDSEPSISNQPSSPNGGYGPSSANPGSSPGAPDGTGNVAPSTSEQPNMPMLQTPMDPMGEGGDDEDPATEDPSAEDPPTEDPPGEDPPTEDPPTEEPPGEGPDLVANDVLLIGDSYLEIPNQEFNRELSRLARAAGMIGENEIFRDRAISGTRLAGGFSPIPQQYANAQAQAPARVLVMDGGGNDIIQSGCESCAGVTNAIAAADALFQQVAEDGTVEQIIFFYYPDFPNFPALRADAMDFMRPRLQSICEDSSVPCEFIDLRPLFVGHPEFTGPDNLHPSVAGSRTTAQAVFSVLEASPIAQ